MTEIFRYKVRFNYTAFCYLLLLICLFLVYGSATKLFAQEDDFPWEIFVPAFTGKKSNDESYKLFSNNYLNIGNKWTYQLHVTKFDNETVDLQGTSTVEVTHTENIEGYNATAIRYEYEIPGMDLENEWEKTYNYLTQDYLMEVRHEDYESHTTVRYNDPLEYLPVWVNDTDKDRHVGHGEFVGRSFDDPPGDYWYSSHDSYITYLGQEQITVQAGTFNCIKVYHYYDWRDDGPDYWKVYRTLWIEPNIGIIREDVSDWSWENSQWLKSDYTLELTSKNINVLNQDTP